MLAVLQANSLIILLVILIVSIPTVLLLSLAAPEPLSVDFQRVAEIMEYGQELEILTYVYED